MTTAVVIPFRPSNCEHRTRNFDHIVNHYRLHHPWPVVHADCEGRWSKGAAITAALQLTDADVVVLADADSFVAPEIITNAAELVEQGAPWVVPHAKVYRQNYKATRDFFDGAPPSKTHLARQPYDAVPGGGITVLPRATYEAAPIDHRFHDWGGEDVAWAQALHTLAGPPVLLDGDLFHLWHPHPSPNYDKPPESESLMKAYIEAKFHPAMMRALIAGEPYSEPPPLDEPRRFRSATTPRTLRCGPRRAVFVDHIYETTDPDMAEAVQLFANVKEV